MRELSLHVVHCSASPKDTTVRDINTWHVGNGWDSIGYHFVIYQDGTLHKGRDITKIGAHARGNNTGSVGTCLIGNEEFTVEQLHTLQTLHNMLKVLYNTDMKLKGHNELTNKKTCPNFNVRQFIKE